MAAHPPPTTSSFTQAELVEAEILVAAHAVPVMGAMPTLIALHDDGENAQDALDRWDSAARQGWLLAAVQSSQMPQYDRFVWTEQERALADIAGEFARLCQAYPADPAQVVVAGSGVGALTALHLALAGRIPALGVVLHGPKTPAEEFLSQLGLLVRHAPPLRVALMQGEDSRGEDSDELLLSWLSAHGIEAAVILARPSWAPPGPEHDPLARALLHVLPPG